jgi:hypothetical protein
MEQRTIERQQEAVEMAEAAAEERQGMTMYIAASMKTRHEAGRCCTHSVFALRIEYLAEYYRLRAPI